MGRSKKPKKESGPKEPAKKLPLNPLPILQDEQESLDREMEEMFEEDRVTHRHGNTEPERD